MRGNKISGIAPATLLLWRYEHEDLPACRKAASHRELEQTLQTHPRLIDSVSATRKAGVPGYPTQAAFVHYIASKQSNDKADEFLAAFATGEVLSKTDGVYLLRERILKQSKQKTRLPPIEVLALMIKAWVAWRDGRPVQKLFWSREKGEDFPDFEFSAREDDPKPSVEPPALEPVLQAT
jgi:hypothetical protein